MDRNQFIRWNEEMFKKYGNERLYFHPNPLIRYTENKRVKITIEFLEENENDRILSLGCGEGFLLEKIKKGEIWGVDLSKEAIKKARKKLKNRKINLLVADALFLPFPNDFFDKLECSETIEHVLDPKKLIEEALRVTKKEAILVFTFPNETLIKKIKQIF